MNLANLTFNNKRLIVGVALLPCLFCVVNYYLNFGIFGRFGKQVLVASFIALYLVMQFIGPTVDEVRAYRAARRAGRDR
jgi:hypothetical protein